jgi:YfiH family protein
VWLARKSGALAETPEADIIVTDDPALAVAVQAADCVPLLFVDRRLRVVAAAHAGWRGLVARVPCAAIQAMARTWGTRPADLLVAAGPSIGACCYEVGADVRNAFSAIGFSSRDIAAWFHDRPQPSAANQSMPLAAPRPDHWFFDGCACVRAQLEGEGVPRDQIFSAGLCTASHPEVLPSYRRDGKAAGRIAGVIIARRP